jgi:hypothetical protein
VRKTCFDLISRPEKEFNVWIVSDGVLSIHEREKEVALEAIRDAGAHITTLSSIEAEITKTVY